MRVIEIPPHPLLSLGVVSARVRSQESPPELQELLKGDAKRAGSDIRVPDPLGFDLEGFKPLYDAVRRLLRHGGYKPSGRGKPASEYLARVATSEASLRSINNLVDINNAVSLHSGLPASVVDADLVQDPIQVQVAGERTSYVFNPSGQAIDTGGLLCVHQAGVPCANAVKDSMATKVHDGTTAILAFLYGPRDEAFADVLEAATRWYGDLLRAHAAGTEIESALLCPQA